MKKIFLSNRIILKIMLFNIILLSTVFISCNKGDHFELPGITSASRFSSDVIDKWITMQIRLMKDATGIPNVAFCRYYAYTGVTAYEALAPGTPLGNAINRKLNGLTGLPVADNHKVYYWPASVNAALASVNRSIFINASDADKASVDSLENALNAAYSLEASADIITRSIAFGSAVATAVFNWSSTDGIADASDAYTPPVGPGLWEPTPPAFGKASTPYFGNLRSIIIGSTDNTQPGPPIVYSEDPKSEFYQMVLNDYTVSQNLTADQSADALFWRDIPGVTTGGHWESILQQVLKQTNSHLDKAAVAYAVTGICNNDPSISCWQTKYHYNLVRPITYIRNVMGYSTWNSLLTTPAHPEYSSAHAVLSAATSDAFTALFGNIGSFTDHTYDYLGYAPRTFTSFRAIGEDAGNSRLYAG
ncbi:MAG: vanadium-dependent haloperoxidase, partial [Ginsengibacter sp.]